MRRISMLVGAVALGAAAVVQAASPAQVVEARQKSFKDMGRAMKAAGDSFKTGTPDAAVVKASATTIAGYADKLGTWFPAGTAAGGAFKTGAKPEIWTDKADFAKKAADFSAAAKAFKAVADKGDLAGTGKAMGALGGTCKGCHEKFRQKD